MNFSEKLKRRDVLTGAASLVGSSLLFLAPGVAAAQGKSAGAPTGVVGGIGTTKAYSLYYWSDGVFIPAEQIQAGLQGFDHVKVNIRTQGGTGNYTGIDAKMPGGIFYAFSAQPQGASSVEFLNPVTATTGLSLLVNTTKGTTQLDLVPDRAVGTKLQTGVYLLVEGKLNTQGLIYNDALPNPVITQNGLPASGAFTILTIS